MSFFNSGVDISRAQRNRREKNTSPVNSAGLYISNQKQENGGTCLLLIDPQHDFIRGTLTVPGAVEDCRRTAQFIRDSMRDLQEIYVTLDSHMTYHIAHPAFWVGEDGQRPTPFTQISHEDVVNEKWMPVDKSMKEWVRKYTKTLEEPRIEGVEAFVLTIWPPHCLIGRQGHVVDSEIMEALDEWEAWSGKVVHYVLKGNNSKTEHYSAFRAEVIVDGDESTKFNRKLFENLKGHSHIYVAGQAKSHCVNFTVRDLVEELTPKKAVHKVILLDGAMSSVPGCEAQGNAFFEDMKNLTPSKGLKVLDLTKSRYRALGAGMKVKDTPSKRKLKLAKMEAEPKSERTVVIKEGAAEV